MTRLRISTRVFVMLVLAVTIGLATAASPFASPAPDGLERVAQDKGFESEARVVPLQARAPAADYAFPGVRDERLATGLAGFAGALLVMGLGTALAATVRRRGAPA